MSINSDGCIIFFVNGERHEIPASTLLLAPRVNLLHYLRNDLGLKGCKPACETGGCGACNVTVSKFNGTLNIVEHKVVAACLFPLVRCHLADVTTIEGLGNSKHPHVLQQRLATTHGTQCGYCSPGMIMSMYSLLRENPNPTTLDIEDTLKGNLCRCTGYRPIIEAFQSFTDQEEECKESPLNDYKNYMKYSDSSNPTFPDELIELTRVQGDVELEGCGRQLFLPTSLDSLIVCKATHPSATLYGGKITPIPSLHETQISIITENVGDLHEIKYQEDGINIGSAVTISQLRMHLLREDINEAHPVLCKSLLQACQAILKHIRDMGTVIGNILCPDISNSDFVPLLVACSALLNVINCETMSSKIIPINSSFYNRPTVTTGNILNDMDLVVSLFIPRCVSDTNLFTYRMWPKPVTIKFSRISCGIKLVCDNNNIVKDLIMVFGGVKGGFLVAHKAASVAIGAMWNEHVWRAIIAELHIEFKDVISEYQLYLTVGLFQRFVEYCDNGCQYYNLPPMKKSLQTIGDWHKDSKYIGKPVIHHAAVTHCTGESVYVGDISEFGNELHCAFVTSTKAHAKILSVNVASARALEGFVSYYDYTDVPGENDFDDHTAFAKDCVNFVGQIIGVVVGTTVTAARKAAMSIEVQYEELDAITTMEEAIKKESFFETPTIHTVGNVGESFKHCDHVIEGELKVHAQCHVYMENVGCICVPSGENDELVLYTTTQDSSSTQRFVSDLLGISRNKVVVKIKRIGGGFGGKELKPLPAVGSAALAAYKLNRAVRCIFTRDDDFLMVGYRTPLLCRYKVGCTSDGRILCVDAKVYADCGFKCNINLGLLEYMYNFLGNVFCIPNSVFELQVCKTNWPQNVAMRGVSLIGGAWFVDNWIHDIAIKCNLPFEQVKSANFYTLGDVMPFIEGGKIVEELNAQLCWERCLKISNFYDRQKEVAEFNSKNKYTKRGIYIMVKSFGVTMAAPSFLVPLCQSSSLVCIYTDGSVSVNHHGVEMGQGLHTKMIQLVCDTLGVDQKLVRITDTSTDKVPNSTTTGGSFGTDLAGEALLHACMTLNERLKPFKEGNPAGCWKTWIEAAYTARVCLSAVGYFPNTNDPGKLVDHFTSGAACCEVEVDCLTGEFRFLVADIVMDVGHSINPAIDVGQVEGGFVQGLGLHTCEEIWGTLEGDKLTRSLSDYKIPTVVDVPREFNVHLLEDGSVKRAGFLSARGIGEPAVLLGSCVFFAIKEAIAAYRGSREIFRLDSPASCERIKLACEGVFSPHLKHASNCAINI